MQKNDYIIVCNTMIFCNFARMNSMVLIGANKSLPFPGVSC